MVCWPIIQQYAHACACTHAHVYMYRNCKWPLTWRHPYLSCLTCIWVCGCMCVHGTWDTPDTPTPNPIYPPITLHRVGDPRNQLKFNNTWTNEDNSILFEDLKFVENPPPMGGCIVWWVVGWVDGWVGWWMGSGQIHKTLINVDPIKIIEFFLKIYDL